MPVTVLLGPAGSGKTSRAIDAFAHCLRERGWRSARYLVPTAEHVQQVTEHVLRDRGMSGLLGRPIATFFDFAEDIARQARIASRPLSPVQRYLVLRKIAERTSGPYFQRAQRFPGFVEALGQQIEELKLAMVRPEQFEARLESLGDRLGPAFQQKSRELAALYREYQLDHLERHGVHDPVGLMWHAISALGSDPSLLDGVELVVLDGFQSFTPVQRRLLELLAGRVKQTIITLDHRHDRPAVFETAEATRRWLRKLEATEECLPFSETGPPALAHLAAHIFDLDPPQIVGDRAIGILEGASPANEVEVIARAIRRLLRDEGYRPDQIAVIAREPGDYARRIAAVFANYGIPVAAVPMPLERTALGRALTTFLRVVSSGWHRSDVVAALRSGLLDCDVTTAGRIDAAARATADSSGRDRWHQPWPDDDTQDQRQQALAPLAGLDDACRAAREAKDCASAVRAMMDQLSWAPADDPRVREQMAARQAVETMLDEIVSAERLIGAKVGWQEFSELLAVGLRETTVPPEAPDDAVALLAPHALGGRRFRAVFVCGLLEKVFPRQMRESPFLRDAERRALAGGKSASADVGDGGLPLSERLPRQAEERYLCYSAIASATERLFLTYPESDLAARDSLRSFYLADVEAVFAQGSITIRRADLSQVAPPLGQVENERERLDAVVHGVAVEPNREQWPEVAAAYNRYLSDDRDRLLNALRSLLQRDAALTDRRILERMAAREQPFAPSELEDYARCPFRHFCVHILGLQELLDRPTPLERGRVLHAVAAEWYRQLAAEGVWPPGFGGRDADTLVESCLALVPAIVDQQPAYRNLPAYERDLIERDLAALVRRLVVSEVATAAKRPLRPTHFELSFGRPIRPDCDPYSSADPLVIDANGRVIRIAGRIDRVDLDADGRALIIDYKSGASAPGKRDFEQGIALQVPLYVAAAEQVFGMQPVGGEYYAVMRNARIGFYADRALKLGRYRDLDDLPTMRSRAEQQVRQFVSAIERGGIAVSPQRDEVCRYCPCRAICHVDRYRPGGDEQGENDATA